MRRTLKKWALRWCLWTSIGLLALLGHKMRVDSLAFADQQRLLGTLAQAAAGVVDPVRHEGFRAPSDMESPAFQEELAKLKAILLAHPDIIYVYTLRQTQDGWEFVLDPTPPGDLDSDGVQDRSHLLDPYSAMTETGLRAYSNGEVLVESEPESDKWGSFYSGYAPIRLPNGTVVGLAGVDISKSILDAHYRENLASFWKFASLLVGLLFCLCAIGCLRDSERASADPRDETVSLENTKLEPWLKLALPLVLVVTLALVSGYFVLASNQGANGRESKRTSGEMRLWIDRAHQLEHVTESDIAALQGRWIALGLETPKGATSSLATTPQSALEAMSAELSQIESKQQNSSEHALQELQKRVGEWSIFGSAACCVTLFCIAALAMTTKRLDLKSARYATLYRMYRSATHAKNCLPIGCFRIKNGVCDQPNLSALKTIELAKVEDFDWAFRQCLHPDDAPYIFDHDEEVPRERSFQIRIQTDGSSPTYYAFRKVPVFGSHGELSHYMAFLIDIDEMVQKNLRLKEQQAYIESSNRQLRLTFDELMLSHQQMVRAFGKAVEAKDPYISGHSERVAKISVAIANALELPSEQIKTLELGCLLHDIGKIGIPDYILTKTDPLTEEEATIIRGHPLVGAYLVSDIARCQPCLPIIRSHHERLDGSGYPDGLVGEEIELNARICMVADIFDAMMDDRAYRKAHTPEAAIQELFLEVEMGRIDGKIVETLADMIKEGHPDLSWGTRAAA